MPLFPKRPLHLLSMVCLMLWLAGCNIFEVFYDEGARDDVPSLIEDARFALQNNDPEGAVELLERALSKEPENPKVRIWLGTALLQKEKITILQLKEVADFLKTDEPAPPVLRLQNASMDFCNFSGVASSFPILSFAENNGYLRIEVSQNVLRRILGLFEGLTLETLEAELAAQGFLIRSVVSMGVALIDIKRQSDATTTSMHRLGDGSIGYCSSTSESLFELLSFIRCDQLQHFNTAVSDLEARALTLNAGTGTVSEELLDALKEARNLITSTINVSCPL